MEGDIVIRWGKLSSRAGILSSRILALGKS